MEHRITTTAEPLRLENAWEWISDWNRVKHHLSIRLVNVERSCQLLQTVPSVEFLDLRGVFYIPVEQSRDHTGYITIRNELMIAWGQTSKALRDQAITNMDHAEIQIVPLSSILQGLLSGSAELGVENASVPMYMLTGAKSDLFGAAFILSETVRGQIGARFGKDMFILPSSVHELLLVPTDQDVHNLLEIVKCVNRSAVQPEDFLADHVFRYCAGDDSVEIAV